MGYFIGKNYFEEDGAQNYLVFQPIIRYFKVNTIINVTNYVLLWKSKGLSAGTIKPPTTSDNSFTPTNKLLLCCQNKSKIAGSSLKQPKISYTHGKVVNIYIVYEFGAFGSNNSNPTLKNCLFGVVTLTKNADINKYGYSGYGTGFDRESSFSFPGGGFGQNVLGLGADMSSSAHIDNKKRHISSRKRTNTRIRTYFNCRKNVFN